MKTMDIDNEPSPGGRSRWGVPLLAGAAALLVGVAGCDSLLDVDNPNNVIEEDLRSPETVNALVNGALAETADALDDVAVSTSALSDELTHTGSQNWAAELDRGSITNVEGRSDDLFNQLSEARWTADEAVRATEEFSDQLARPRDRARAYLIAGINYLTIADNFEDFVFSDRTEIAPPVGPDNMISVYDEAIDRFDQAESIASGLGATNLVTRARALRARAHWGKALWPRLNPPGDAPADPLIDDEAANADAEAVLAAVEDGWTYDLEYSPDTQDNDQASWITSRQEFVVGPSYAVADSTGKRVDEFTLEDPIDDEVDPLLVDFYDEFLGAGLYPSLTVVSAAELHLILAEAALVNGETGEAADHINAVRALKGDDVTAFDPGNPTHPSVEEMIRHERRVHLFYQPSRRILDMYRFDVASPHWAAGEDAHNNGQKFVIGQDELVSNCHILGTCPEG